LDTSIERKFKDNKETVGVILKPSFSYQNYKLSSTLLSKPEKEVSLEVNDLLVNGSTIEVGANENESCYGSVGFVNDQVNLNLKLDVPYDEKDQITLTGSGALTTDSLLWALHGSVKKPAPGKSNYDPQLNARIHFVKNCTTISFDNIIGTKDIFKLSLLWSQKLSETLKVATRYCATTDPDVAPVIETVIEKKGENGSIFKSKSSLLKKEKADNLDLTFQFSYTNKFSSRVTYTLGADLSARELLHAHGNGVSLGFEVKLK